MRGRDLQDVADKLSRRKTRPRVGGIIVGMRTSIQIDDAVQRALPLQMESRQLSRDRVDFFPDLHASGRAPLIWARVRSAGKLRKPPNRFVIGFGPHPSRLR